MLRSMYSGVSGLRGHQAMMDVVGNNIANVNTVGFKASQAVFQDVLSQLLQGAGLPEDAGGTNPAQVGLGMRLAATVTSFAQGGLQNTGRSTDLSIQGDGFFAVRTGAEVLYTRAGAFSFDANGRLVTPQGAVVQGWLASPDGTVATTGPVRDIVMPVGQLIPPTATTNVRLGGNLPKNDGVVPPETPKTINTSITVYDEAGTPLAVTISFTENASADTWDVTATVPDPANPSGPPLNVGTTSLTFAPDGSTPNPPTFTLAGLPGQWTTQPTVTLGDADQALTQYASLNTLAALGQDGAPVGALQSFTISPDGVITGVFSNGRSQAIGQIALATFNNPEGLEKAGSSMFRTTVNSGLAQVGVAGSGRGVLAGGTLEMSNVDLAQEFTNLIVAQRGFQANSRVISTSDELLQDLVNLKR